MCCSASSRRALISEYSLSLPLVNVDTLMNAVINTDPSLINEGSPSQGRFSLRLSWLFLTRMAGAPAGSESPLPDFVPNTHPSEPSLPVEKAPTGSNDIHRKSVSPSPPPMLFGLPIPPPPSKVCKYVNHLACHWL